MSDDINVSEGKEAYVGAVEPAWHGLGVTLPERFTSKQALKHANLNFKVKKVKTLLEYEEEDKKKFGKRGLIPNTYVTYRADTGVPLCTNGKALTSQYEVIQNKKAFAFFDEIIGQQEAIFETAGALGMGQTVFITAKLPDKIMPEGDQIDKYLLFRLSHDGSSAIQVAFTPIRIVCSNTLTCAIQNASSVFSIRHTQSAHDKLDIAKDIISTTKSVSNDLYEIACRMIDAKITYEQRLEFLCKTFLTKEELREAETFNYAHWRMENLSSRKQNLMTVVMDWIDSGVGQNSITRNNVWGLVNGVTSYFQNKANYTNKEKKMISIIDGHAAQISKTAFNVAKQMIN